MQLLELCVLVKQQISNASFQNNQLQYLGKQRAALANFISRVLNGPHFEVRTRHEPDIYV